MHLNKASELSALLPQIIKSWLCEQMVTSTQYTLKVVLTFNKYSKISFPFLNDEKINAWLILYLTPAHISDNC